jgi:hypothetical protein
MGKCVEQFKTFKCVCEDGFEADDCNRGEQLLLKLFHLLQCWTSRNSPAALLS